MLIPDTRQTRVLGGAALLILGWLLFSSDESDSLAAESEPLAMKVDGAGVRGPGGSGGNMLSDLVGIQALMATSNQEAALGRLEEHAENLVTTDPERAVALLEKRAAKYAEGMPMTLEMRKQLLVRRLKALEIHSSAESLAEVAKELLLTGDVERSVEHWMRWESEPRDENAEELARQYCWAAAAHGAQGMKPDRDRLVALAASTIKNHADARASEELEFASTYAQHVKALQAQTEAHEARRREQRAALYRASEESLTRSGSDPARFGGLGSVESLFPGGALSPTTSTWGDSSAPQTPSWGATSGNGLYSQYINAKIAYEGDLARYESEQRLANSRGGRLGALGISVNPTPPDPALHRAFLSAKAAYEASR